MGLVRGVTRPALLVRRKVEIEQGSWPQSGEVLMGRMAATKLGANESEIGVGQSIELEGRSWRISGIFSAGGSAFESEAWCRLDDLQQAMKRQDLSIVALAMKPDADFSDVDLFCKEDLIWNFRPFVKPITTPRCRRTMVRFVGWPGWSFCSSPGRAFLRD